MPDLERALHSLTDGQPAQPGDRLGNVTRKAKRMRATRTALSAAAVIAIGAPLASVALAQHHATPNDFASSPLTSWPDRSQSKDQSVAKGALSSYEANVRSNDNVTAITDIHWLYRGDVKTPDSESTWYVAILTAKQDDKPVVVSIDTLRASVTSDGLDPQNPTGAAPWNDPTVVPLTSARDHVGLYLTYNSTDGATGVSQQLFVLGDPSARALRLHENVLPYAEAATGLTPSLPVTATSSNGVFSVSAGRLLGDVSITQVDKHQHALAVEPLTSLRGADIELAQPRALDQPADFAFGSSGTVGENADGTRQGFSSLDATKGLGRSRIGLLTACYGGGEMTFVAQDATGSPISTGRVACDGQPHSIRSGILQHGKAGVYVQATADRLVAYTFDASVTRL